MQKELKNLKDLENAHVRILYGLIFDMQNDFDAIFKEEINMDAIMTVYKNNKKRSETIKTHIAEMFVLWEKVNGGIDDLMEKFVEKSESVSENKKGYTYFSESDDMPKTGSNVIVLTSTNHEIKAKYESISIEGMGVPEFVKDLMGIPGIKGSVFKLRKSSMPEGVDEFELVAWKYAKQKA